MSLQPFEREASELAIDLKSAADICPRRFVKLANVQSLARLMKTYQKAQNAGQPRHLV